MGLKMPKLGKKSDDGMEQAKPKKQNRILAFLSEYKKQLITTGIVGVICLVIVGIANVGVDMFAAVEAESEASITRVKNEMANLQASDSYFTQDAMGKDYQSLKVEWQGVQVDTARWMTDENIFWDFISPAFSFNSATEYNKMREDYIAQVGNCLFTVQFLAYYDIESKCRRDENGNVNQVDFERYDAAYTCSTDKSQYMTYPVAVDNNGDYTYIAMVPMKSTYVAFTYKIVHSVGQGGSERITLSEFDCWPPNSRASFGT